MRRVLKVVGWATGIVFCLVGVAIGGIYFFATSDYLRSEVERRASGFSGRKTSIASVSIDWGSTTRVFLEGLKVANADWAKAEFMLKSERVELDVRLWPLLRGDVVLPRLVLNKPEVSLEIGDKGQLNWSFGESPVVAGTAEAVAPEHRYETPFIERLEVVEGRLSYRDTKRKLELDGTVTTATGKAGAEPQAELSLKGTLEDRPLTLNFVGGSALMLRDTTQPYPLDVDVAFGATTLKLQGTVHDPFKWTGANVDLSLAGPNLADIYPLLGIPGPPTPPYRLSGKLDREKGIWRFHDSKWRVGESDLSGEVLIDEQRKPAFLTAKLVSQRLIFADLAPLVGVPPDRPANISPEQKKTRQRLSATGELFPNVPLHVERLRAMNMDVTLDAKRVIAPPYLPVRALTFRVNVDGGRATVKPLTLALAGGGTIAGELAIDARTDHPKVTTNLMLGNVEFGAFFRESRYFGTTHGKLQGRVVLAGTGRSVAEVMSRADGHAVVSMAGGSVSALMVTLAGLQIADALILYITGDNRIPIKCALGRLVLRRGVATFDRTLLDTQKSVLHVRGQVSLPAQVIKLEIRADPKKFDLLNLHGPVIVEGKLGAPRISLGRVIPIPTPVFGDAQDIPCAGLTRELLSGRP